jgi:formylglycine-generating enzyme required for sulfatase activity
MRLTVIFNDGRDDLHFATDDWPIGIGGAGCRIPIDELSDDRIAAHFGVADGAVFVLPAADTTTPIHCNGVVLTASRWLEDGDRLAVASSRLVVRIDHERMVVEFERRPIPEAKKPERPEVRIEAPQPVVMVEPANFTPRTGSTGGGGRRFGLGAIALWSALVIMGAMALVVLTGRTVEIVVEPTPDRLEVHGSWPVLPIDGRFFIHPGSYEIEAELVGYRPFAEVVEIDGDSGSRFNYTLEPLPGRVRITTGALTNAEILVNGETVAVSPATIDLPQGEHAIVVRAQRHAEAIRRIAITKPGEELELDIILDPAWAVVHFRSEPAGAEVIANGHALGVTPLTAELGAGRHAVEYRRTGYESHRIPISVTAGVALELPVVRLARAAAQLKVTSDPPGASVTIDDTFKGVTPLQIAVTPDLEHELTLAKGGFALHSQGLRLASGQHENLAIKLMPLVGTVRFRSQPPGAELFIDGESRGRTDLVLELEERTYQVEIRLDGFLPLTTTITPRGQSVDEINVVLKSVAAAAAARRPPVSNSPQGVELRLIEGGRFTAGASRRVPGRRANETLINIEISHPFYLATREVTNREFRAFSKGHRSGSAGSASLEIDHHPAVRVSWNNAARYCNWLSEQESLPAVYAEKGGTMVPRSPLPAGYRLPTEAEWVWAARYDAEGRKRKYGWGSELPIPSQAGNYGDQSADPILGDSLPDYSDGYPATAPVGSFRASQRGLHNMGGNVSEWVQDLYTIYPPSSTVMVDPLGPSEGEYHVIRGASWMDDTITELRLSYRDYGDEPRPDVGFRIARSAP